MRNPKPATGRRALIAGLIIFAAYYASVRFGLVFAVGQHSITAIWPASGVAVAALYLEGRKLWPAVLAGALLGNLTTGGGDASWLIAAGNTLEAVAAVTLLRTMRFSPVFKRERHVVALVIAALASASLAATIGTLALASTGTLPWNTYGTAWRLWWLGDATGILIAAPPILLIGLTGFGLRRRTGSTLAVAALTILAASLTLANVGPFVTSAGKDYNLLLEQAVMGGLAVAVLGVASALARNQRARFDQDRTLTAMRKARRDAAARRQQ